MMHKKEMLKTVGMVAGIFAIIITAWYIKQEINYRLLYKSKNERVIAEALAPLKKRLDALEEIIKKGKGYVSPTI